MTLIEQRVSLLCLINYTTVFLLQVMHFAKLNKPPSKVLEKNKPPGGLIEDLRYLDREIVIDQKNFIWPTSIVVIKLLDLHSDSVLPCS